MNVLTIPRLNQKIRECWPEYETFQAGTYFAWPGPSIYMYPKVEPKLYPDGATTPQHMLNALCAKGLIKAGAWAVLVEASDL